MLQQILNVALNELYQKDTESEEFKKGCEQYSNLLEELRLTLTKEQEKKLIELEHAFFSCAGQCGDDGLKAGLEAGFKLGIRLIFDSLLS